MLRDDDNSGYSTVKQPHHSTGSSRSIVDTSTHARHTPTHLLAASLLSFWLTTHQTVSQTHDVAFGLAQTFPTPGRLERFRIVQAGQSGDQKLLLWSAGSNQLVSVDLPLAGPVLQYRTFSVPELFDDVFSSDLNGDGLEDLLFVQKSDQRLALVLNLKTDSLRFSRKIQLPFEPTKIVLGDVNNDKRIDILVTESRTPGIVPFMNRGQGSFRQGAVISPDNTVQDISLVFLNNDFLSDMIFYDWVKSELHFSYGVGRGRFLDLMAQPVQGSVNNFTILPPTKNRFVDIVLELQEELQVWEGDETGDFHQRFSRPLEQPLIAFDAADIDNDGQQDFAFLDQNGTLKVILALVEHESSSTLEFFVGNDATQLVLADCNGDAKVDALVLKPDRQEIVLYLNAKSPLALTDSLSFVTGRDPGGVWVGDVNGDKTNDILLVNTGSNTLSLYVSEQQNGLRGQVAIPLPKGPQLLTYHSATDTTVNFIVTYPSTQSISFLSIHETDLATVNAFIPDVGELELLYANRTEEGSADFFCYNAASGTRSPSLVFYQQLGEQTFIERTFRLSIPDILLGAAVGDVNNDGFVDVAFAYRNDEMKRNELVVSLGDSSLNFTGKHQILPLPEGAPRRSYMWMQDFGRNDTLDLLLVFPRTLKQMFLAKGTAGRNFEIDRKFPDEVILVNRSQLQILDFDNDGLLDVAMHNTAKGQLGWYRGVSGGGFSEWQSFLPLPELSHFAFGDLNGDGIPDLAVTYRVEGLLTIYDGRKFFHYSGADVGR